MKLALSLRVEFTSTLIDNVNISSSLVNRKLEEVSKDEGKKASFFVLPTLDELSYSSVPSEVLIKLRTFDKKIITLRPSFDRFMMSSIMNLYGSILPFSYFKKPLFNSSCSLEFDSIPSTSCPLILDPFHLGPVLFWIYYVVFYIPEIVYVEADSSSSSPSPSSSSSSSPSTSPSSLLPNVTSSFKDLITFFLCFIFGVSEELSPSEDLDEVNDDNALSWQTVFSTSFKAVISKLYFDLNRIQSYYRGKGDVEETGIVGKSFLVNFVKCLIRSYFTLQLYLGISTPCPSSIKSMLSALTLRSLSFPSLISVNEIAGQWYDSELSLERLKNILKMVQNEEKREAS
jgi:hypothetical protein